MLWHGYTDISNSRARWIYWRCANVVAYVGTESNASLVSESEQMRLLEQLIDSIDTKLREALQ